MCMHMHIQWNSLHVISMNKFNTWRWRSAPRSLCNRCEWHSYSQHTCVTCRRTLTAQWPRVSSIGQNLQPFSSNGDISKSQKIPQNNVTMLTLDIVKSLFAWGGWNLQWAVFRGLQDGQWLVRHWPMEIQWGEVVKLPAQGICYGYKDV